MTKLSISLAAVMLSVTFAPSAQAYWFEPTQAVALPAAAAPQLADAEGVCAVAITPILAEILALPDDWRGSTTDHTQTALACADDK